MSHLFDLSQSPRIQHRCSVLFVGDSAHSDFAEAVGWLESHCDLRHATGIAAAKRVLLDSGPPQVILFAQSCPGQFSQAGVEQLHVASPLSRLVVLLGSWCEGETRTGRPWAGVVRIFWHQWAARMIPELSTDSSVPFRIWRLPRSTTGGEQLACTTEGDWHQGHGLVVVHTRLFRDYQALSDACAAGGYASVWDAPDGGLFVSGAAAALFCGIGGDPDEAVEVARLAKRCAPAPVVVLLDFLRGDDRLRMARAGAAAMLAKPFVVGDLLWYLGQHVRKADPDADATRAA